MKKIKLIVVAVTMLLAGSALAKSTLLPADLTFSGKPIDSLCFSTMGKDPGPINLTNCGAEKEKYTIKGQNANLIKQGYIGNDYEIGQGYSYYKFFNAGDKQYWIYSINNGGGTGEFTNLSLAKRTSQNELSNKDIIGGDRCNGGVENVKANNNKLSYSVNLTAFAFLPLTNDNPHNLKSIDDLADCAICCAAKAFYQTDANTKPTLQYVELAKVKNIGELVEQGKYQACFNKLYFSYITKGKTRLNENELKQFVKTFNDTCVK